VASPRVSIVCTVRDGGRVLAPTLESVLAQSFGDWELVVVDDGSTDETAALVRRHAARDPRIRLVATAGVGRARALNLAIATARGDFVANIDADDPSHPRRIEAQLAAFQRDPGYALIASDHLVLLGDEEPRWPELPSALPDVVEVGAALRSGNPINHSSAMVRRRDLLEVGGYAEDRARQVDYELFVRLVERGRRLGVLPLKLASRRLHPGQSFEARDRLHYLLGSLAVQRRAIRSLPGSPWALALLPARLAWGLAPRGLRARVNRLRRAPPADGERPFRTEPLRSELRTRSVRGAALASVVQVLLLALRVVSILVLARLLTPTDFGLVAMVLAVTGVVDTVRGTGLSTATVRWAQVEHRQVSTLFWVNAALSFGFALLAVLISPLLVWFYGEGRLLGITAAIALSQFIDGMSLQHQALLRRQMRFTALYAVRVLAAVASRTLSIGAALLGAGYWALVSHHLTMAVVTSAGSWIASGWRPGLPRPDASVRSMLSFGRRIAMTNVIRNVARYVHDVGIGKFAGTEALGFYSRAYTVLMLPIEINQPVGLVATSGLSRLQDEPARYRAFFRKALLPPVAIGMPLVAFLLLEADAVILVFLGPQWNETVPIFRALSGMAFVATFAGATQWVYHSGGRADRQLRWWLIELAVVVTAVAVGIRWGAVGVAAAASIAQVAMAPAKIAYCIRFSPLVANDVLGVLWRPALASFAAVGLMWAIGGRIGLPAWPPAAVAASAALYGVAYLAAWMALPGGARELRSLLSVRRDLRAPSPGPVEP